MTDETKDKAEEHESPSITIQSTRFGDLVVSESSLFQFPAGLIGFPRANNFILLDHKPPFSWLHSADDANLAFVVIDGAEFGQHFGWKPPYTDKDCDFQENDEFAVLLIVTVRPDPKTTTVNLKAPLFVNIRNRKGVQVIYDDARYSTRHPLWDEESAKAAEAEAASEAKKEEK